MKSGIICKYFIGIIFLIISNNVYSQKNWRLEPSLGLQFLKGPQPHNLSSMNSLGSGEVELNTEFGLMFRYRINQKLDILTGWKNGGGGYGFDFIVGNSSSAHTHSRTFVTLPLQRFPISLNYLIKPIIIDRSVSSHNITVKRYLGIELRLLTGISVDYIVPTSYDGKWFVSFSTSTFTGIKYETRQRYNIIKRYGASGIAGIKVDINNLNKHIVTLNLLYSYGLGIKIPVDVNYTIGDDSYQAQINSRGSFLCFSASYPIKFFKTQDEGRW